MHVGFDIGSYVYLRPHGLLYSTQPNSQGAFDVLHAVPQEGVPPVSILSDIIVSNGQLYYRVNNPYSRNAIAPIGPTAGLGGHAPPVDPNEPLEVLVSSEDIRTPDEVVGMVLPAVSGLFPSPSSAMAHATGADISLTPLSTKLRSVGQSLTDALGSGTVVALGATALITLLLLYYNPKHRWEVVAGGVGLASLALYVNQQKRTGMMSISSKGVW